MFEIIDESLMPLFETLLLGMQEFGSWFLSTSTEWMTKSQLVYELPLLASAWKNEELLKENFELSFIHKFLGFKQVGTDAFNIRFQLNFRIDNYWYGFALVNHNDSQPFLKKLYGEQLTSSDIHNIVNTVMGHVVKDIDWRIDALKI